MNNNYGNLLEYSDKEHMEDPYKGFKKVRRGGKTTTKNMWRFEAPTEVMKLKLKDSRMCYELETESNIVPDNDLTARMIKKIDIIVNDVRLTSSWDEKEPAFYSLFSNILNFSREAQESELMIHHFQFQSLLRACKFLAKSGHLFRDIRV